MATKVQKEAVLTEITEKLKSSDAIYLTDCEGMTVAQINRLRREFRSKQVTYKIFKNKLMKRAMEQLGGYDQVFPYLENQTAFAFVSGDMSTPAKVLKTFLKDTDKPKFKAAIVDGSLYSEKQLEALATMKTKDEVLGDIIGLLLSPMQTVVGQLQAQGSNLVGAIKTIAEKEN